MKKIILWLFTLVALLIIGVGIYVSHHLNTINNTTLNIQTNTEFSVGKGASLYRVIEGLKEYAPINDIGFRLWLYVNPEFAEIKAGLYELEPNSNLVSILSKIRDGDEKQFAITLVEGQTLSQWLKTLNLQTQLVPLAANREALYTDIVKADDYFCANEYKSLEGCLLPDTYFYTANTQVIDIVKRAYAQMQNLINERWNSRFKDVPLNNKYEALILASIIEKETAIAAERSEIAGVFANRLEKNMRLQTDPTVIYGIGESFNGDITRKDLRTKTPYNTYMIKGLPITPIAMPSSASIEAALMPALTDSLYFVASGDGGHVFSTNLADHNKAVRAYLKKMKQD